MTLAGTVLALLLAAAPPAPAPAALARMVDDARAALDAGEVERAAELYEHLAAARPDLPEAMYDLGVARHRAGDLEGAAEAFTSALDQAEGALRAASLYNLGTTAVQRTRRALAGEGDAAAAAAGMEDATQRLREALDHYKQAIVADPADEDARANAELTHRLLRRLEQMMQQQQNQDQQQQQDQDQQQDQQGQPQDQPQSQGPMQEQDQQEEPRQQEPSRSSQEQPESSPQSPGEEQEQEQPAQPEPDDGEGEGELEERPADGEREGAADRAGEAPPRPRARGMSKEEAERLLQMVRDKERRRREALAEREQGEQPPVEKDW